MRKISFNSQQGENRMNIVRIATANNFNCTESEFNQVRDFELKNPGKRFFVNCNINTPLLSNINLHGNNAVITVNPDLKIPATLPKLNTVKKYKISFLRVKWLPHNAEIKNLIRKLSKGYKVVITVQRFRNMETMNKFSKKEYYTWSHNYFRLNDTEYQKMVSFKNSLDNVYICDEKKLGCPSCGLCSHLNGGNTNDISELNLSSSGFCRFNCPSCFAKCIQKYTGAIAFDKIKRNSKMKGKDTN